MQLSIIRFLLTGLCILCLNQINIQAQDSLFINGPTEVCFIEGVPSIYTVSGASPNDFYSWILIGPNGFIQSFEGSPIEIFWLEPGNYLLEVVSELTQQTASLNITVSSGGGSPEIFSTATFLCPANTTDSIGVETCEKVCANSTVTYSVESEEALWTIEGSDNYTIDGHQVTVEWGESGTGNVSVNTGNPPQSMNVYCGVNQYYDNGFGEAYVYIDGGNPPFTYILSTGQAGPSNNGNPAIFEELPEGTYSVTVTDASGESEECDFEISQNIFECYLSAYADVSNVSSCLAQVCDGAIDLTIVGANGIDPEILWIDSNGTIISREEDLFNLCGGTYTVEILVGVECGYSYTYEIGCDGGNSCGGESSICVEILEEVEAAFTTTPTATDSNVEICQGQTLFFENQSNNAEDYLWNFGDGNFSTETNPEYVYANPGTYEVILIARNECFCSDTTSIVVEVTPTESPSIDCVGAICPETSVTYTSDAACSNFDWLVSNNGIVEEGGGTNDNFITITWNDGIEGTIQLATTGCSGGGCDVPSIFKIPIISNGSVINGPSIVCKEETAIYSIPDFDGTAINWTVSAPYGTILSGQGTNQITVQWSGNLPVSNQQFVQVDYDNCYLGCSGSDILNVDIVPEYFITGDIEACVNDATVYRTQNALNNNPVNSHWTIIAADGSVFATSTGATNAMTVDWTGMSGRYIVQAIPDNPNNFCNETSLAVNVLAAPPKANDIQGEDFICPTETYTYAAVASQANVNFKWHINNGGTVSEEEGRLVNVTWGTTPPYSLSLTQIGTQGLPCESDTISMDIEAISSFTITGTNDVCEDAIETFSATVFENVLYHWTISPASTGTIVEGQGTADIDILWHEAGAATVNLEVCGSNETFNVTVHAKPEPIVNHPLGLCEGETAEVTTSLAYTDYIWTDKDGVIVSTLSNPMLGGGHYKVSAVNQFGCRGDTTFYIIPYPMPEVRISSPDDASLCPGGPMITIYALDEVNGYTYQWYLDNVAIAGATNVTYMTNEAGTYQVEVTDENNCTARSNTFIIRTCAELNGDCQGGICVLPGDGSGTCIPNGMIDFNSTATPFCNEIDFTNTSTNFIAGTLTWNFDDPNSGATNVSNLENPSHVFSDAGFFQVELIGQVQDANDPDRSCIQRAIRTVEVKAVANFDHSEVCAGEVMEFKDISRFLPPTNITAWSWNFADPTSGADNMSNVQNPSHVFITGGIYDVELLITTTDGCQASIVKEIEVFEPPVINFNPPVQNCQATALNFIADVPVEVTSIHWNFGDSNSGAANTSELFDTYHAYENTGNYTVTMTATSIFGCTNTFSQVITVTPNSLNGDITAVPMSPICEGDSSILTAPNGATWLWSTGETSQSITVMDAGIYKVLVMDNEGCEYRPTPMIIDVISAPEGSIRTVEFDDFGQAIDYFYSGYETCEGEDVYLEMLENANYTYAWSSGGTMNNISFTDERGNLLSAGDYDFTVTITDNNSGCSNVIGPFTVNVHPNPQNVSISSSPSGTLCAGTSATLSVNNPATNLTYQWNTGETGNSITVFNSGEYYVQATNEFGCSSESNRLNISEGPRIKNIPSGCHTRCNPDTICLPDMPNVVSYQWYLDGVIIPAPEGMIADYIATESGDYTVEMFDAFGCQATSEVLTLDLFEGFGTLSGDVYFDVNDNGIIDAADTLMSNINVLLDNGTDIETTTSNTDGAYAFIDVLSTTYTFSIDSLTLPANYMAVTPPTMISLEGCDDMETFDCLIKKACEPVTANLELTACTGTSIDYEGNTLQVGDTLSLNYTTAEGCDSMLLIKVEEAFSSTETLNLYACDAMPMEYEGTAIPVGSSMDFIYTNVAGCDSILTVHVLDESSTITTTLLLEACDGEMVTYNGINYLVGTRETLVFQNQYGCDSLVELRVEAASMISFDVATTTACPDRTNGTITVENISGGKSPYEFSLDGVNFQEEALFENLSEAAYTLTLRDANACIFEKNASIAATEKLEIEILNTELPCHIEQVEVSANLVSGNPEEVTWTWADGSQENTFVATAPGIYSLEVRNACESLDFKVEVRKENFYQDSYIYIPTAFSPNEDNINDAFFGQMAENAELMDYELQVFDRWGNKLFETFDINIPWDGNLGKQKLKPGVYIWSVKAKVHICEETLDVFKSGDVTIMR